MDWEARAKALWNLLDDIDTLGDSMKPEVTLYFRAVNRIAEKRHEILKSDGYELSVPGTERIPGAERVHLWFGVGDGYCAGPIDGILVGEDEVHIVDEDFLKYMGFDEPWKYQCCQLMPGERVSYDDFAWTRLSDPIPEHNPKFW